METQMVDGNIDEEGLTDKLIEYYEKRNTTTTHNETF